MKFLTGVLFQSITSLVLSANTNVLDDEALKTFDFLKGFNETDPLSDLDIRSSTSDHRKLSILWNQIGQDINGDNSYDYSGEATAVSADGLTVAIGARGANALGLYNDVGRVRVYNYDVDSDTWIQMGSDILGEFEFDSIGSALDISGDGKMVIIGSPENDEGAGPCPGADDYSYKYYDDTDDYKYSYDYSYKYYYDYCYYFGNSGHVRVYKFFTSWNLWVQVGEDIDGTANQLGFGYAVSMSSDGTRIAASVYDGYVQVYDLVEDEDYDYKYATESWIQVGSNVIAPSVPEGFGRDISLSADGNFLAVGSPNYDISTTLYNVGAVKVYKLNVGGTSWTQRGQTLYGSHATETFGYSVSLSEDGKRIAIGSHNYDLGLASSVGRVTVYDLESGTWNQVGSDVVGENEFDYFGRCVSLSYDGSRFAVGAAGNDDAATAAGEVYVYGYYPDVLGGTWIQIGQDIQGEAIYDYFGYDHAVALSGDGSTVAASADLHDADPGFSSGETQVFKVDSTTTLCKNGLLGMYLDDGTYFDSCLEAGNAGACDTYEQVRTHCPVQCGTCSVYKCTDSTASLNANGAQCPVLLTLPDATFATYCGYSQLQRTCRGTCNWCGF